MFHKRLIENDINRCYNIDKSRIRIFRFYQAIPKTGKNRKEENDLVQVDEETVFQTGACSRYPESAGNKALPELRQADHI